MHTRCSFCLLLPGQPAGKKGKNRKLLIPGAGGHVWPKTRKNKKKKKKTEKNITQRAGESTESEPGNELSAAARWQLLASACSDLSVDTAQPLGLSVLSAAWPAGWREEGSERNPAQVDRQQCGL